MSGPAAPRSLPASVKRDLRILFIAKHAHSDGSLHAEDGTHATYHREMRLALQDLGLNLTTADDYAVLFGNPAADFVFPLLNRGGFLNSEMLLPLLCERLRLPYLGASPILRGLADDKHLCKQAAAARGVPTAPWAIFRRGAPVEAERLPPGALFVVKPNASSASWGVSEACDWPSVRNAVLRLHDEGHDAIVEPFVTGHDIEVSVLARDGDVLILPTQIVEQADPGRLRSYEEKRNLCDSQAYEIRPLDDPRLRSIVEARARAVMREFVPFDYGRCEFRLDLASGEPLFLEVNLNCNLWSRKTIAMAAAQIGWSHGELVETILVESLARQGLLRHAVDVAA